MFRRISPSPTPHFPVKLASYIYRPARLLLYFYISLLFLLMSNPCASCGKADANLKACNACKLVKYCGRNYQVAHRPAHKKACRKAFNERLYAQPPQREDCPICMIPLSCYNEESTYSSCCGKFYCVGCRF